MEKITLATAETVPATADYQVDLLTLDWAGARIRIELRCLTTGKRRAFDYTGPTATAMMVALNKANLSTNSLHKRVLNQLITDNKLEGSVAGSPD